MAKRARRIHNPAFKAKVALAAVNAEKVRDWPPLAPAIDSVFLLGMTTRHSPTPSRLNFRGWRVSSSLAQRGAVGTTLIERVMETGSLVVRKPGGDRGGEMALHRFLAAPSVTTVEIVETLAVRTAAACAGRRIVVSEGTTEINFAGREERRRGLGPAGDGISAGFFIHPLIAIDSEIEAVLGLVGAKIWTRTDEIAPTHARALEDQESIRWLEGAECAAACLADAASVVVVADREGDINARFAIWSRRERSMARLMETDFAAREGGRGRAPLLLYVSRT